MNVPKQISQIITLVVCDIKVEGTKGELLAHYPSAARYCLCCPTMEYTRVLWWC